VCGLPGFRWTSWFLFQLYHRWVNSDFLSRPDVATPTTSLLSPILKYIPDRYQINLPAVGTGLQHDWIQTRYSHMTSKIVQYNVGFDIMIIPLHENPEKTISINCWHTWMMEQSETCHVRHTSSLKLPIFKITESSFGSSYPAAFGFLSRVFPWVFDWVAMRYFMLTDPFLFSDDVVPLPNHLGLYWGSNIQD